MSDHRLRILLLSVVVSNRFLIVNVVNSYRDGHRYPDSISGCALIGIIVD